MAGDIKLKYGTPVTMTVTNLQSLASSTTNTAGWMSGSVDNTSNLNTDFLVSGEFKMNTSAPTTDKSVKVWAIGAYTSTPVWPSLLSSGTVGTEGAATMTDEEERDNGCRLLWSGIIDASASAIHSMPPTSIAQAFGNVPPYWCLFVAHDTGLALASSGNVVYHQPILMQYT